MVGESEMQNTARPFLSSESLPDLAQNIIDVGQIHWPSIDAKVVNGSWQTHSLRILANQASDTKSGRRSRRGTG